MIYTVTNPVKTNLTLMLKKFTQHFLLFLCLLTCLSRFTTAQAQAYTQNFNDIATLPGLGWHIQNNSSPVGALGWFQGTATNATPSPGPFNAHVGAPNAYIAANFNSTGGGTGIISNWLMTPNRTIRNGDVFSFYTRKPTISAGMTDYPDRLEVRLSTNGASTNAGTGNGIGDFTTLLLSINPTLTINVYPQVWTQYTITISGLPAPTSGRIAFRYFVTNAGPTGSNSDYIGIDEVAYTPYVCPAFTMTAGGALTGGTAGTAYSQALTQTGSLGAPNFAITAGALPPGLTIAANGTISGIPTATGTFNFGVTVNDASGCSGSQNYSITVVCPSNPIVFTAPSVVCGNTPVTLTALPAGGTFSGTGVSGNIFDPSAGSQNITYDYADPYGCPFSSSTLFTVADGGVTSINRDEQNICSGSNIATISGSNSISGATINWSRNNTGTVTGIAASGTGDITGSLVNTTNAPVLVTFTVTATVNGCTSDPLTSTVLVYPTPTVSAITPQSICSGSAITTINLAGPVSGTSFSWTRDNTTDVTGIAASGTGAISGSLTNTTNAPVTVTFTITPAANGCDGAAVTTTVVVNPAVIAVATPATQTLCSGNIEPIILTSNVAGTTYTWTRDNSTTVTGIAASGTGDITGSLVNNTINPVTVTFTITPTANGCPGEAITATVVVGAAPIISCPANISVNNITGTCGATATYSAAVTGIPAPEISYSFSGATTGSGNGTGSGATFNVGITTVTLTATNSCGVNTCSFTVTVVDTQAPTISCPPAITVSCPGEVPAPNTNLVTANDNCPGVTVTHVTDVISNQTCASRYSITRTYRATDASGNSTTCTQIITVNDETAPVISLPANITVTSPIGSCNAVVNFTVNATDNCSGPVTITSLPASGSVFALGTTTVTTTATDACGNTATASFTVTVLDGQLPVIATQPANRVLCFQQDATFSVTASNTLNYQWQTLQGADWVNINGATASTYTVPQVTLNQNGNRYRVRLTGTCTTIYSEPALLSVNALPQPVITSASDICLDDKSITLQAAPAGGIFSGSGVSGANWNLEVPAAGSQTINYTYTDANGCTASTSKIFNLKLCSSFRSILEAQAFPNPTQGKITIKVLVMAAATYRISANNINGEQAWRKDITLREGWNTFEVDLTGKSGGVYTITLSRSGGVRYTIKVLKAN